MWCDASTFRWAEQGRAWRFSLTALFGLWVLKSLPSIGASYPRRNACPRIFSIQFLLQMRREITICKYNYFVSMNVRSRFSGHSDFGRIEPRLAISAILGTGMLESACGTVVGAD